jgi:hypothetical protein
MQPSYPAHWQITPDHRSLSQLAAWAETQPLALGEVPASPIAGVARETLHGLQVMELHSSELFRRYFGDTAN